MPVFPEELDSCAEFLVCFDVFVHMDLHTQWAYWQRFSSCLAPGGMAFVSTANVLSHAGWQRFASQTHYTVGGFHFVSPDTVLHMIRMAGLQVVVSHSAGPQERFPNVYLDRDFLVLVRKPALDVHTID